MENPGIALQAVSSSSSLIVEKLWKRGCVLHSPHGEGILSTVSWVNWGLLGPFFHTKWRLFHNAVDQKDCTS